MDRCTVWQGCHDDALFAAGRPDVQTAGRGDLPYGAKGSARVSAGVITINVPAMKDVTCYNVLLLEFHDPPDTADLFQFRIVTIGFSLYGWLFRLLRGRFLFLQPLVLFGLGTLFEAFEIFL